MNVIQVLVAGVLLGGVYALVSVGLTLAYGVVRIVNFAHGAIVMMAMYASFFLVQQGINPYAAIAVIIPAFFLLGMLLYQFVFRLTIGRPHVVQIFASFGLLILLENLALLAFGSEFRTIKASGPATLDLNGVRVPFGLLMAFIVSVAVSVAILVIVNRSKFGLAVRGVTQDRLAATLMGVSANRVYAIAFGVAIACAGLAGGLLMPIRTVFPTVGVQFTLVAFVVVVLGGMGSVTGALLGGLIVGTVESLAGYYLGSAYQQLAYFALFVLILLVRPSGLLGSPNEAEIGEEI